MIKDIIIHVLGGHAESQLSAIPDALSRSRGAVAQRRSRASGLTRLSAAAIRGFGLGFGCRFACQFRRSMVLEAVATGSPYQEEHGLFE